MNLVAVSSRIYDGHRLLFLGHGARIIVKHIKAREIDCEKTPITLTLPVPTTFYTEPQTVNAIQVGVCEGCEFLAAVDSCGQACIWTCGDFERPPLVFLVPASAWSVNFMTPSKLIVGCNAHTVTIFDFSANSQPICTFSEHGHNVPSVSSSTDGHYIASVSIDGTCRIRDVQNPSAITTIKSELRRWGWTCRWISFDELERPGDYGQIGKACYSHTVCSVDRDDLRSTYDNLNEEADDWGYDLNEEDDISEVDYDDGFVDGESELGATDSLLPHEGHQNEDFYSWRRETGIDGGSTSGGGGDDDRGYYDDTENISIQANLEETILDAYQSRLVPSQVDYFRERPLLPLSNQRNDNSGSQWEPPALTREDLKVTSGGFTFPSQFLPFSLGVFAVTTSQDLLLIRVDGVHIIRVALPSLGRVPLGEAATTLPHNRLCMSQWVPEISCLILGNQSGYVSIVRIIHGSNETIELKTTCVPKSGTLRPLVGFAIYPIASLVWELYLLFLDGSFLTARIERTIKSIDLSNIHLE